MLLLHKPGSNAYAPTSYVPNTTGSSPGVVSKSSADTASAAESSSLDITEDNPHVVVASGLLTMIPIDPDVSVTITTVDDIPVLSTDVRFHVDLSSLAVDTAYQEITFTPPGCYIDIFGDPETALETHYNSGVGSNTVLSFDPAIVWYRMLTDVDGLVTLFTSEDGASWDTVFASEEPTASLSSGPLSIFVESDDYTQSFIISEVIITDTTDDSVIFQDTFSGTELDLAKWVTG